MQTQQELKNRFDEDIDHIVKDLIDGYGLRHEEEVGNLSEPLLRWIDFVTRYIAPRPRKIFASNKFPKTLSTEAEEALRHLKKLIESGSDINPYQSKGLILHNDTSANKRQKRTDLLWADWGIYHLHLTTAPIASGKYFSERTTKWLLFCIIGDDFLGLIDIRDHSEPELFSNPDLIKTVVESWPEIMERYRINGVLSASTTLTATEIATLRKGGVSSFVTIGDNQVYMGPGMGVTTASTPIRVTMAIVNIRRYLRELARIVHNPTSQFKTESAKSGITNPEYSISLTPQGLAVYEKHQDKAFIFPRGARLGGGKSFLAELHDLIAPEWAIDFVTKKSSA
jgi:hypothetical protein